MANLVPEDLRAPKGPVTSYHFPDTDSNVVDAQLEVFLNEAYADERVAAQTDSTKKNLLARAYALWKTFEMIVERMALQPATLTVSEKGGHAYTADQREKIQSLADKYQSDFLGMLRVDPEQAPSNLPGTLSSKTVFEW